MESFNYALHFTLKVVSRCNLNCTYCYVFNKADQTWRDRPAIMSDSIFTSALDRIRSHCIYSGQEEVRIVFHGGEPCLAGPAKFAQWCRQIKEALQDVALVNLAIQTNGTLLNEQWIEVFKSYDVTVGISIDGPKSIHDVNRVDHSGRGSYDSVRRGITLLLDSGFPLSFLSVIQFNIDPVSNHRHLLDLGAATIDYIFPDYTHDTINSVHERYGTTPCADYLIPVFDDWWFNGTLDVRVGPFEAIAKAILGGKSQVDFIGNRPLRFLFIETDGAIEGLDVLRVCKHGMSQSGLNVTMHDFLQVAQMSDLHREVIFEGTPLPKACKGCHESKTCAGGYFPHRYSSEKGFNNSSVWCKDLLSLFAHIRERLQVSNEETYQRREVLSGMAKIIN